MAFRQAISKEDLPGVLKAYNESTNHTFYLAAGCAVAIFVFSWGLGWKSVKKTKVIKPDA